jgi:hypothetical protein
MDRLPYRNGSGEKLPAFPDCFVVYWMEDRSTLMVIFLLVLLLYYDNLLRSSRSVVDLIKTDCSCCYALAFWFCIHQFHYCPSIVGTFSGGSFQPPPCSIGIFKKLIEI